MSENELEKVEEKQGISIFGTLSPQASMSKAVEIADMMKDLILDKNMFTNIHDKKYVHCEGWTTMGALLGVFAHIVDVEDLSHPEEGMYRYRALCEVKNIQGQVISKAESECSNDEKSKTKWENYALRSMAETRAISKTLRICIGWIMKLAGYEVTPAEEMEKSIIDVTPAPVINPANGEVDVYETELAKECPKPEGMTVKDHKKKEIEYLGKVLKLSLDEFKEKVFAGDFDTAHQNKITEVRNMLMNVWARGLEYKKIAP